MTKLRFSYSDEREKEKLLDILSKAYAILKPPKVSTKGTYKKVYVELQDK